MSQGDQGSEGRIAVIVDDEVSVFEMLSEYFADRGYRVVGAETFLARLGLQHGAGCPSERRCADVLLLDNRLGNLRGLDVIESLAAAVCRVPVAAIGIMSGEFLPDEEERARRLGCRIFRKPFDLSELDRWLDEVEAQFL